MEPKRKLPSGWPGGCLMVFGFCWAMFFLLALFGAAVDEKDDPISLHVFIIVLLGVGIAFFVGGVLSRRKNKRLAGYVDIITEQGHYSVEKIAKLQGVADIKKAMNEIQLMINRDYLPGVRLDPDSMRLIPINEDEPPQPAQPRRVTFLCSGCGAANSFDTIDSIVRCEFCGTPYVEKK